MAEPIVNTLGIVGMKNCGVYDNTTVYEKLNVVTYQGSSYCAKGDTVGHLPTDTDYWDLLAQKGDTGETGEEGPQGPKPVKGVDYYTAEDIAELESTLANDVSDEVSTQLGSLTSATPLVASSTADMTDTTRIYVNTTDGHWYWYNENTWVDGGLYQATSDHEEVVDIRTSFDNLEYNSAGESVRIVTKELYDEVKNDKYSNFFGYKKLNFGKKYGKCINAHTGNETTASDYYASDYIDVSKYKKLYVSYVGGGASSADFSGVSGYDANKNFVVELSTQKMANNTTGARHSVANHEVFVPSTVKYIRGATAYKNSTLNNYPFGDLLILAKDIDEKEKNDIYTYDYKYLTSYNTQYGSSAINCTDGSLEEIASPYQSLDAQTTGYIPVEYDDVIYITGSFVSDYGVCAYDENKEFVEEVCGANDKYNIEKRLIFKKDIVYRVPSGVSYIRGSSIHNTLVIKKIIGRNSNKKYFDFDKKYGKSILSYSGNENTADSYYASDYIDVKPGDVIYYTGAVGGGQMSSFTGISGYDLEGTFVTRIFDESIYEWPTDGGRLFFENVEIVIPNNVYKIKASTCYKQGDSTHKHYAYSDMYISKLIDNTSENNKIIDELIGLSEYNTYSSGNATSSTGYKKLFTVAAISDIHHDDYQWLNFMNNSNNKKIYLDCSIFTGDIVGLAPSEDISFYQPEGFEKPLLSVVGNHDAADLNQGSISQTDIFNRYIKPLVDAGFVSTDKPYYYKDFSTYQIRVIVLHEYEGAVEDATGNSNHYRRYMTSTQLQWFADTLYNTPSNYSVIVLTHQIIHTNPIIVDCKFTGSLKYRTVNAAFNGGWGYQLNNMNGNPIGDIVNAFITGTSISQTYTNNAGKENSSVAKDFSTRGTGKFICYISGHTHFPFVLKDGTYNNQIQILLPSGSNSFFQRKSDDIRPLIGILNSYYLSFDTTNKLIKILKEGHRTTMDMVERDKMIINY